MCLIVVASHPPEGAGVSGGRVGVGGLQGPWGQQVGLHPAVLCGPLAGEGRQVGPRVGRGHRGPQRHTQLPTGLQVSGTY